MSAAVPTKRTHVLIAAGRVRTRGGLRPALGPEARCAEDAGAGSAVDAAIRERPDVCLLGLDSSGQGLRTANEIAARVPTAAVILLTNRLDEEEFMAAVRAGASGYLTNSLDPSRLLPVVQGALRGEPAVPRKFVSRLLDELRTRERRRSVVLEGRGRVVLTTREWDAVELLLRGATTSAIAEELGVAPVTVRRHLGSVEQKLGVTTRAEAIELLSDAAASPAA